VGPYQSAIFQKGKTMKLTVHWKNANGNESQQYVENLFKRELLKQVDFNEDALYDIHQEAVRTRNPSASMLKIYAIAHLNTFWGIKSLLPSEKNNAIMTMEWAK
jgi:hypothetical protein